mmetsp:Transcript_108151/g.161786  ORF Transcript_108151/g.161786 Transcript_108151/m.161786 type:complete len:225 (-) Transcript_108151:636-1310(-)
MSNGNVISEHGVPRSIAVVGILNQRLIECQVLRFGNLLCTPYEAQMSIQVGSLFELSTAVPSGSRDKANVVVVVEEHAVKDFVNAVTGESFQVTTGRSGHPLKKLAELEDASFRRFDRFPKHFRRGKIVLQKGHHAIIANDNVAVGSGFLHVVVSRLHATLKSWHQDFFQRFLVDRNLNRRIHPVRMLGFLLWYHRTVFCVRTESLSRDKAFENTGNGEIGVPK